MADVLFVAWNRLAFTRESFEALLANTDWAEVERLFVHDDASSDGTAEYLAEAVARCPAEVVFQSRELRSPVAAMNWYLDSDGDMDRFAKVDNDFVVCPGWLNELLWVFTKNPGLDIVGMEPTFGPPTSQHLEGRSFKPTSHIGGKGLIRKRAFVYCKMVPDGRLGFTAWQERHDFVEKGWVTPDLPVFGLDQLPFEPWASLTQEYVEKGWQREWPKYEEDAEAYWDWWKPVGP